MRDTNPVCRRGVTGQRVHAMKTFVDGRGVAYKGCADCGAVFMSTGRPTVELESKAMPRKWFLSRKARAV